jgi:hypothetical protein
MFTAFLPAPIEITLSPLPQKKAAPGLNGCRQQVPGQLPDLGKYRIIVAVFAA